MGLYKSARAVASIQFRRWVKDIRVHIIFAFTICLIIYYLRPITMYGLASGKKSTGFLLPLLFRNGNVSMGLPKMYFHVGMLVLLCDAPFLSPETPYMILRSHRNGWWLGECLYIIGTAFVYTVFLTVVCFLMALPVISMENDWGSILNEVANARAGGDIGLVGLYTYGTSLGIEIQIVRYLLPMGAELYVFFAIWGSFTFLGLLMYLISLVKRNVYFGMTIAGIFIFLDPMFVFLAYGGTGANWLLLFSPVSWTSLNSLKEINRFYFVSTPMALGLYVAMSIVLCFAIWRCSRRAIIELVR